VPGADSYPERYPLTLVARLPRAAISLRTPLADGNIAVFANRWRLIDDDTLPDYLAFVRDHAGKARALVATPVSQRTTRYRLLARGGRLVVAALTRWEVDVGPLPAHPRAFAVAGTKPLLAAETGGTVLDLSGPPTRESVGLPEGTDSRVWMNPNRRPFGVAVELPGGRVYRAWAELVVMLSSTRAGDPDRLTVQLPSAGLEVTERLITQYAAEWGFPTDAVASWRTGAERRASSDRDTAYMCSPRTSSALSTSSFRSLTTCARTTSSSRRCFRGERDHREVVTRVSSKRSAPTAATPAMIEIEPSWRQRSHLARRTGREGRTPGVVAWVPRALGSRR
jgi:hypothetical protein